MDKFFSDSLTGAGIIEDDDYTRVVFNSFSFGCVVKGEAFVKVHITELEPRKERAMRVLLDQEDIQAALEAYVAERGISGATGVKLSAEDGELTAEVLFGTTATTTKSTDDEDQPPKPKNRGGRPAGSKNKPKEDSDDVGSSASGGSGSDAEGNGDKGGNNSKTFSEDDEDDLFDKGVGQPKENPSGGSQEESSMGISGADEDAETETSSSGGVKKKASSIFDDED